MSKHRYYSSYNNRKRNETIKTIVVIGLFIIAIVSIVLIVMFQLRKRGILKADFLSIFDQKSAPVAQSEFVDNIQTAAPQGNESPETVQQTEDEQEPVDMQPAQNANLAPIYDLYYNVDFDDSSVGVQQLTRFTNTTGQPLDKIYFRLYPNIFTNEANMPIDRGQYFPDGIGSNSGVKIITVMLNQQSIIGELQGDLQTTLEIIPPAPVGIGESAEISLEYTIKIPRGEFMLSRNSHVLQLNYAYAKLAEFDNGQWQTSNIDKSSIPWQSSVATFLAKVEVDRDYSLACTGDIASRNENDGRKIYEIQANNVRDLSMGVYKDAEVFEDSEKTIMSFAYSSRYVERPATAAQPIISFYKELFGVPLGYQLKLAETRLRDGMNSKSQVIFFDESYIRDEENLQWILALGIAEQYLGNLVEADPKFNEQLSVACASIYMFESESSFKYKSILDDNPMAKQLFEARKLIGTIKFDATIKRYITDNMYKSGGASTFVKSADNDQIIADALAELIAVQDDNNSVNNNVESDANIGETETPNSENDEQTMLIQ